jgi:hypothetical protein
MMLRTIILWCACLVVGAAPLIASASEADVGAIRHVMMATWDKPESRLVVEPVVIAGDHAIAGWSQGEMGGRALLRRKGTAWEVVLCAGDDLKRADVLHKVGLSHGLAVGLAQDLAAAEKSVAPARLALFSKFEGLVMVSAEGGHHGQPSHHAPQGAHAPHGHK